jgi:putative peptide modification system cyclase
VNAGVASADVIQSSASSVLRTLVLCDLVDSMALIERLGDRLGAELIRKHDRLARTIADRHGGQEIDKTDGFLMMFDRPIQAVAFALDYQRGLKQLNAAEGSTLSARVGIHVGDVVVWDNSAEDIARGAKPIEVEGLVKPITSRLMSLALPGQILLSNIAYALAHRAQGELGIQLEKVRWRTHGRYRFRGIPDPVPVFEVGEEGVAPLKAPPWSSKAHREVPFWRRPATVVIEALVVAALIAIPITMFLRPEPAIAFANRDWVVVGNLQNLTGEKVFDEALESALRIGLEQSRYVNVLPDLKVRDTVKRMERDPDTTKVDRAIGSEVAIRDGARALILPTIAEIGGRVRITAEVIDPQTQTTVYSESADGLGAESVLPSLDTINSRLRVRLGEALATVSSESKPLEQAATSNLDALRIYSQGVRMRVTGDQVQANLLFRNAIDLDPRFARARIELATVLLTMGKRNEAIEALREAQKSVDRLSARDRLMTEALLADFASPRKTIAKWQALAASYPDLFRAQGAYGYYAWHYANDFDAAIVATQRNIAKQNPDPGLGHYLLGTLLLGMEKYKEAEEQFSLAENSGARLENHFHASAYAAQRRFDKIDEVLARGRTPSNSSTRLDARLGEIGYAADQGRWKELDALVATKGDAKLELDPEYLLSLDDARLAVRTLISSDAERKTLAFQIDEVTADIVRREKNFDPKAWNAHLLFRGWLAARSRNMRLARSLLAEATAQVRDGNHPALEKMLVLVESELASAAGNHKDAVAWLHGLIDGQEPYAAHVALMDALIGSGDFRGAREQARWLAVHRGRAYTEVSSGTMFIPFNVVQSNLALLTVAECSIQLGELDDARKSIEAFRAAWPNGTPASIAERTRRVDVVLARISTDSFAR